MLKLISTKTHQLKKKQINAILLLKDEHWRFGIKSQYVNFEKNIFKFDINNCLYLDNQLIGYTALKIKSFSNDYKKKYFLFDTFIIKKKYQKKGYSKILMNFNNFIISNNNKNSFLICEKKMIKFYKNFNWKNISKNKINFLDHKTNKSAMCYNFNTKNLDNKKIHIYLKK